MHNVGDYIIDRNTLYTCAHCGKQDTLESLDAHRCPAMLQADDRMELSELKKRIAALETRLAQLEGNKGE